MGILGILIVIVCAVLILIVLVQNSKGGGLASNFASNNQILGVAKTKDILEQITWIAAGALFLLCVFSTPKSTVKLEGGDQKTEQTETTGGSITKTKATTFAPNNKTVVPNNQPGGPTGK